MCVLIDEIRFNCFPQTLQEYMTPSWIVALCSFRVHSSFPWHFEKMFTATLLALGTRLVKFQISNFGFQACLSLISTQIFNFKHPWAHLMLNCSIFKAKLAKTDIFTKVEKWNFTSLVPRARSVAVNIFSKCHGTDEWTLFLLAKSVSPT